MARAGRAACGDRHAWVLFVPAARSPLKERAPRAPDTDRVRMLERVAARVARAGVWTDEIDRADSGAPSYWVETLRRARTAIGPGPVLRFIVGVDQVLQFRGWKEWREILKLAEPIVLARPPIASAAALGRALREGGWNEADSRRWGAWFAPGPLLTHSSTDVRRRIVAGQTSWKRLVPKAVAAWITRRRLYGA